MRIKAIPSDFTVEESLDLPLMPSGPWAVYRLRKEGLTTLELQTQIAHRLGLSRSQVVFPALKDRTAVATQHLCLPAGHAAHLSGPHFSAERIGYLTEPLQPKALAGNAFHIVVRDLADGEAHSLTQALQALGAEGLPNYFDVQRMGSFAPGWGFIGRAILDRDAEAALRAYLARPFLADPEKVRRFKRQAAQLWPDWPAIMAVAPRPSNFRSVLTYLIDHPEGYRKALNLIPPRLLALYLAAYQSHLWNLIASAYLESLGGDGVTDGPRIAIAGADLSVGQAQLRSRLAEMASQGLVLPNHRAVFPDWAKSAAEAVLAREELALNDLKARILKRAYLPKSKRPLWLLPERLVVEAPFSDELNPGREALRVRFALPRGSYATLLFRVAAARTGILWPKRTS
ncbi:MAG: tRNA pseudouridine(13) synthase TruD [Anaerolineae bacterium]|nr:tRNA pseudouridine(13) synthase TruD [Anaerolineae bacterium]